MSTSTEIFCKNVKSEYPEISAKADKEYTRLWGDFTDSEFYSYSWFEALANALNYEMCKDVSYEKHSELFALVSLKYSVSDAELKNTIDVTFVENLFWQVPGEKASSYWKSLPENLKELYVNFHHRTPL